MKIKKIFFLLALILTTYGCEDNYSKDFYLNKGGFDYRRIPLIQPYQARNNKLGWSVKFHYKKFGEKDWTYVSEMNVQDSIIFLKWYGNKERKWGEDSTWAFIIPSKKVEVELKNEKQYLDSLSYYTNTKPVFKDIEIFWKEYSKTLYLEWFPEKYKMK